MEFELAKKLEEMDFNELIQVLTKLKMTNHEAFTDLKEIVDDTL
jgi:hypothetical protein